MWSQFQSAETTAGVISFQLDDLVAAVNRLTMEEFSQLSKRLHRSLYPESESSSPGAPGQNEQPDPDQNEQSIRKLPASLTKRESEVLTLVASGYSRKEIGITLDISENTAACHIASIYRKLDISTIAEATRIAIECRVV